MRHCQKRASKALSCIGEFIRIAHVQEIGMDQLSPAVTNGFAADSRVSSIAMHSPWGQINEAHQTKAVLFRVVTHFHTKTLALSYFDEANFNPDRRQSRQRSRCPLQNFEFCTFHIQFQVVGVSDVVLGQSIVQPNDIRFRSCFNVKEPAFVERIADGGIWL